MTPLQPPSPERLSLARELVALQDEIAALHPRPSLRVPRSMLGADADEQAEADAEASVEHSRRFVERHAPPERQREIRAGVLAELLAEAELREALAFLGGRTGRRYLDAVARAGAALAAAFQQALEEHGDELRESADERMRRWLRAEGTPLPEEWESDGDDDWTGGGACPPPRG